MGARSSESKIIEIEKAVAEHRTGVARRLIPRWLKANGKTLDNRIRACEWLRRLSMYREAYLVIAPKTWNFIKAGKDPQTARQLLWTAYILSLHGANRHATKIADRLSFNDSKSLSVLGGIYLLDREYAKAIHAYRLAQNGLPKSRENSYQARALVSNISQILSHQGHHEEAISLISSLKIPENDHFWKGWVLLYRAQFRAMAGEFTTARKNLREASDFLDKSSGLKETFFKYQGYIEGALGNTESAIECFSKAFSLLYTPDSRAEFWLDCYYFEHRVGLANADKQLALFSYPHLNDGFRKRPKFVEEVTVWSPNSNLILMPDRDEWIENGKHKIKMSRELKLLSALRASGEFGISVERLKSILWPDDLTAFMQLNARIGQLLFRLKRQFGVTTKIDSGVVRITETKINISVEILRRPSMPVFFENNSEFEAGSFAEFYGLGLTAARSILDSEIKSQRLVVKKLNNKFHYTRKR